jgi:hypothetical protein
MTEKVKGSALVPPSVLFILKRGLKMAQNGTSWKVGRPKLCGLK